MSPVTPSPEADDDGPDTATPAPVTLPDELVGLIDATKGFMPADEGLALHAAAVEHLREGGVALEIGTYCGKSTIYLAHAASVTGSTVVTIDHHREIADERPTIATTTSSSPESAIARRAKGRVSINPVWGSTSDSSWYSQPGCCSSEPRWWSIVTTVEPVTDAAWAR